MRTESIFRSCKCLKRLFKVRVQQVTIKSRCNNFKIYLIVFFKIYVFTYSWETQRERQRHRQREKQAPYRKPDVGLDPGTPGSWPELKADTQPLSHPGVPKIFLLKFLKRFLKIYSWETHRERQRHKQRKKQGPREEPNVGLNLRTPGPHPASKADAQPLSHPGTLPLYLLYI